MKKYVILFLIGILLFELTFYVALKYFYDTNEEFVESEVEKVIKMDQVADVPEVEETSFEEEKIGQNTRFIILESYSDCGHNSEIITEVDSDMVNLSKDEFEKKYDEYKLKRFSRDEVIVEKENKGICDEHFKISMGEDFIEVFKLNQNGEEELYLVTGISRDYLAADDIHKLNKGIEVYGKGNINSKLEDYE